jgi:hypothetical protein
MDHGALAAFSAVWAESRRVEALEREVAELRARLLRSEAREDVCRCFIDDCQQCGRALLISSNDRYEGGDEVQCTGCGDYYCEAHFPIRHGEWCCPECCVRAA